MRITIATSTSFHLARLASELAQRDHAIDYFTYAPAFRLKWMAVPGRHRTSVFFQTLPTSALAQIRGNRHRMGAVEQMFAKADDQIARRLRAADIFIGLSSVTVKSAQRARELGSFVIVERASQHVEEQNKILMDAGARPLSKPYMDRELASYDEADLIVVPSHHAAQSFYDRGFTIAQVATQPLGVDLENFRQVQPVGSRRHAFIFVGNWSVRKGCDILLNAIRAIPTATLTHIGAIGDTPFPHGDPQFETLGHKNPKELARLLGGYEALVLPSREDGFGMVLLEALASGVPVVASRRTGAPDIRNTISEPTNIELVHEGDTNDLVRGLESTLSRNRAQPGGLTGPCLSSIDRAYFSWSGYALRYESLLDAALTGGRRRAH